MAHIFPDLLPDVCVWCGTCGTVKPDRVGYVWCSDCEHRGQLLNWGRAHGWPRLPCYPYVVGKGQYCWCMTIAVHAPDDLIWLALAAIEYMEEQVS